MGLLKKARRVRGDLSLFELSRHRLRRDNESGGCGFGAREGSYLASRFQRRCKVGDGETDFAGAAPHGLSAAGKMTVKVKLFAILRERAGVAEVTKEIKEGSTVADLWAVLQQDYPKLAVPGIRLLYAVNQDYVKPDRVLKNADEVVFVPPVSGG